MSTRLGPKFILLCVLLVLFTTFNESVVAQQQNQPLPKITIQVDKGSGTQDKEEFGLAIQILFLITILSLTPAILIMMTSFTRLVIVFHFLRMALGTQQAPANQIIIGLSLFLTFFVMQPVWNQVNQNSLQPYLDDKITQTEALDNALQPVRKFMLKETREKDLKLFVGLADIERPQNADELPMHVLIPSFVISELRVAFQIGFMVYLPLVLIDLIVGVVLMSMGMMMLPPITISLPFKVLVFILVDGWYLVVESVISGILN